MKQIKLICTEEYIASGTSIFFYVTESNFNTMKRCSSIVLSVRLDLNLFAEEEGKVVKVEDGVQIAYDTKCGFDAAFSEAIDRELKGYIERYKQNRPRSSVLSSNYETLLWSASNRRAFPLEEQRVLDCAAFAIIFRKPTAYSKIKLEEMIDRVRWPTTCR